MPRLLPDEVARHIHGLHDLRGAAMRHTQSHRRPPRVLHQLRQGGFPATQGGRREGDSVSTYTAPTVAPEDRRRLERMMRRALRPSYPGMRRWWRGNKRKVQR
jgi:hypothetical protein